MTQLNQNGSVGGAMSDQSNLFVKRPNGLVFRINSVDDFVSWRDSGRLGIFDQVLGPDGRWHFVVDVDLRQLAA